MGQTELVWLDLVGTLSPLQEQGALLGLDLLGGVSLLQDQGALLGQGASLGARARLPL